MVVDVLMSKVVCVVGILVVGGCVRAGVTGVVVGSKVEGCKDEVKVVVLVKVVDIVKVETVTIVLVEM
jgi:hypothetical protein